MTYTMKRRFGRVGATLACMLLVVACDQRSAQVGIRGTSEGMRFNITADSLPPHAQDRINYRITVRDAKTGEPIEGGEGMIFASFKVSADLPHSTGEGLSPAPQLGTYTATMSYVVAGLWSVAINFRRDSLSPFARLDWKQEVLPPRPIGG